MKKRLCGTYKENRKGLLEKTCVDLQRRTKRKRCSNIKERRKESGTYKERNDIRR
jgi:hypothetical protein